MSSNQFYFGQEKISIVKDSANHWEKIPSLISERKVEGHDEAFYVTNLSVVLSQYRKWQSLLPTIQPHFAIKANPDDSIIRLLGLLGAGFDCASKGEIDQVLSLGISPDRIIYANTIKPASYIRYAMSRGVSLMTVDNAEELQKIKENAPNAKLVLRIAAFDHSAICKLSLKFGCEPVQKAPELMKLAAELGLKVVGVSFHVGGGSKNPRAYAEAIAHAKSLFQLGKELGFEMTLLDIGGGFPGFCSEVVSLAKISGTLNPSIKSQFADWPNLRVISEPGRFFAMPSSTLCLSVIGKSKVPSQLITDNPHHDCNGYMYYVNDGVFGSFNCVPVYKIEPPAIAIGKDISKMHWSRVWGPTCDSADVIAPKVLLPELDIGDWLAYEYMGAYTRCIATQFNGFPNLKVYYIMTESDSEYIRSVVEKQNADVKLLKPIRSISARSTPEPDSGMSDADSLSSLEVESPEEEHKPIVHASPRLERVH